MKSPGTPTRPALHALALVGLAAPEERPSLLERLGFKRKPQSQAERDAKRRKRRNMEHHEEESDTPAPFVQCPKCSASLRANHMDDHMKRVH